LDSTRARIPPKLIQIKPSKIACFSLDLLGFIRPNRDFSMGCERKNKKNSTRVSGCVQDVSSAHSPILFSRGVAKARLDPATKKSVAQIPFL
jgi:hypothetical protein